MEFLYEPKERLLSFLEVNTRLQVEHPVTEATTGVDIVKLQLHVAAGGRLADVAAATAPPAARARDRGPAHRRGPGAGLRPGARAGSSTWRCPAARASGWTPGWPPGDLIPPQFDSMIAKVIAWGRDRAEARARLSRALRQTAAVIDGGTTNKSFLLDLLDRPEIALRRRRHHLAGRA